MTTLQLERKGETDSGIIGDGLAITPAISDEYWGYRVRLSDDQAVLGFPKFWTIGIGFAQEDDWNTNLPYTTPAEEIFDHIAHNKGDEAITRENCIAAIRLIQDAVKADGVSQ